MISTDKAFDMLPYVADIYGKLDIKDYIKNNKIAENDDFSLMTAAFDMGMYVMKHSGKIKNEIYEIVAIAQEQSVEEIKKQSLVKTLSTFKEVFANKELVDFFKSAMS